MGKRKNQQRKKKLAGNLYLGPTPEQKIKNTVTSTDKRMHSSLKANVDIGAQKSNLTQPLNYALELKKRSTNIKNAKIPENKEIEDLIENKFPESKIRTFQDTVEEDIIDFLGFSHISDYKKKSEKTVTQTSEPIKKTAALNQKSTIKHKSKSCTTNTASLDQDFDFKEKTVAMSLKENGDLNLEKYISDKSTSCVTSEFQSGYKFVNEKHNFKKKNAVSNQIKEIKHGNKLCATYSTYAVQDQDFKEKTVDISVKENSDLKNEKCLSGESISYAVSDFHSGYKFMNGKDNFKKKNAASNQIKEIKHDSNLCAIYSTYTVRDQDFEENTVDKPVKENSDLKKEKYLSDESTSYAVSDFHSGYKFVNEEDNFKVRHSKEISNAASKIRDGKNDQLYVKDYETSTCKIQENLVHNMQKENSLSIEKYISNKSSLCTVSFYQPHYEYVNERKSLKLKNSNKIATFKSNYSSERDFSSYPDSITHPEILDTESQRMKKYIYSTISAFKESNYYFDEKYKHWLKTRIQTLENLKKLVKDLHDDQLTYNKAQKTCRQIGCASRIAKPVPSTLGYIASVSAFLSDAASGIASVVQAVNIDLYSKKFEEIMNLDSKATKDLYDARSQCLVEYQGIEEVIRKYHSPTFNSTLSKMSNDLKLKQFWMDVSNAYENDDVSQMLSIAGNFLESGFQFEALQKIGDSIVSYIDENPATLEVCNSVCRAASGAIDSLYLDTRRNTASSQWAQKSNNLKIINDMTEINRLSCIIDGDSSQSKLEDKIHDAVDSLKFEMKQITDAYIQQIPVSDCFYDCEFLCEPDYESFFCDERENDYYTL